MTISSVATGTNCSGWVRVAAGLRLVASAIATRTSETTTVVATRTLEHSVDASKHFKSVFSSISVQKPEWPTDSASQQAYSYPSNSQNNFHIDLSHQQGFSGTKQQQFTDNTSSPNINYASSHDEGRKIDSLLQGSVIQPCAGNDEILPPKTDTPHIRSEVVHEDAAVGSKTTNSDQVDFLTDKSFFQASAVNQTRKSLENNNLSIDEERYEGLREGKAVPASRLSRAAGFAALGAGIAMGTVAEYAARLLGSSSSSSSSSAVVNDANADRLAATLCRMRGAALKMGQMLSIQDESLLPPALTRALKQVRQGADAMPKHQLIAQLESQLGDNWRDNFLSFDEIPFAAASIGQVHRATILDKITGRPKPVVVKVQFPGVANSIASDLNNLKMLVQMTGLAPRGLFIDNVIRVGREELQVECDYLREIENQKRFKQLVENDQVLRREKFYVPDVIRELTATQVITSEYAPGGTIDKVSHLSQDERNRIGRYIMYLTIQELFVWRFMQTDPNWGNFLFDIGTGSTYLVDFGAAREYSQHFVDGYLRIVWSSANRDEKALMEHSSRMKFLTGEENSLMLKAHKQSGFTVAEPFMKNEPFDFRGSNISSRMSEHTSVFLQHRLTPPPEEVYTLHRKLAGAYMLCIKLGSVIECRDMLENVVANHDFQDGLDPPIVHR